MIVRRKYSLVGPITEDLVTYVSPTASIVSKPSSLPLEVEIDDTVAGVIETLDSTMLQRGFGYNPSSSQEAWFIDPVGGDDTNDGLTGITALKTVAALFRRWGAVDTLSAANPIIVTIMGDLAADDPINFVGPRLGAGQLLVFRADDVATTAVVTAFGVTAQNPATNTPWSIQGNAGAFDFTPHVGSRTRVVGGPNDGATFTILGVTGGGFTAIIDKPVILPASSPVTFNVTASAVSNGDTLHIVQQVKVELDQIQMTFEMDVPAGTPPILTFANLEVVGSYWIPAYTQGFLIGCKINPSVSFADVLTVFSYGTCFLGNPSIGAEATLVLNAGSCIAPAAGVGAITAFGGIINFDADVVLFGGGFVAEGGFHQIAQLAAFNASAGILNTGAGVSMITSNSSVQTFGSIYGPTRLWGANNAMGVSAPPGGVFDAKVAAAITVTGAGGDFQVGGQATGRAWNEALGLYTAPIACTWANLATPIGGGGFGGNAHDVATRASVVQ